MLDEQGLGIEAASAKVDRLRDRTTTPLRLVRLAGQLGSAISWLPLVSTESAGLVAQADRFGSDLDAASSLLRWAEKFTSAYDDAESAMVLSLNQSRMAELRATLGEIEAGFKESQAGFTARGRPAGYAIAAHVRPFSGMFDDLEEAEQSVFQAGRAGERASRLVVALLDLAEASGLL